jgi:hypothetical protein
MLLQSEEFELLTDPERWPYAGILPVIRRGGNPIRCAGDRGIVSADDLRTVISGVTLGEPEEEERTLHEYYSSPEALLKEWSID